MEVSVEEETLKKVVPPSVATALARRPICTPYFLLPGMLTMITILQSFGDFRSFGGWNKPAIKQYVGDRTECGVGVDFNYY